MSFGGWKWLTFDMRWVKQHSQVCKGNNVGSCPLVAVWSKQPQVITGVWSLGKALYSAHVPRLRFERVPGSQKQRSKIAFTPNRLPVSLFRTALRCCQVGKWNGVVKARKLHRYVRFFTNAIFTFHCLVLLLFVVLRLQRPSLYHIYFASFRMHPVYTVPQCTLLSIRSL